MRQFLRWSSFLASNGQDVSTRWISLDRIGELCETLPSWNGRPYWNRLWLSRVYDLKTSLMSLTKVPPERQKILGLVKGKLPPDQERMSVLTINLHMMLSLTFSQLRPTNRREIIHANRNTRRRRDQGPFKLPHYLSTFGACINM